jgi:hypothetical protein
VGFSTRHPGSTKTSGHPCPLPATRADPPLPSPLR